MTQMQCVRVALFAPVVNLFSQTVARSPIECARTAVTRALLESTKVVGVVGHKTGRVLLAQHAAKELIMRPVLAHQTKIECAPPARRAQLRSGDHVTALSPPTQCVRNAQCALRPITRCATCPNSAKITI